MSESLELTAAEREQYRDEGFFVRESVFDGSDLARLREAAERVAIEAAKASQAKAEKVLQAVAPGSDDYRIDGNRYVEAADATVQFEHSEGSKTIRVIEPFHHLDPVFDTFIEDPRIVVPLCGVLEADQIALWTDKINLKRPREGSGFRWHQDSPYWNLCSDDASIRRLLPVHTTRRQILMDLCHVVIHEIGVRVGPACQHDDVLFVNQ